MIHVFAPDEHVKKHIKGKLLRWAMKLMNYTYVIEHIAGPQNVWADMISRWAGNHDPVATAIKRVRAETPGEPKQHGETTEGGNVGGNGADHLDAPPSRGRQLRLADVRRHQ
ncbi:hypothetical protein PF005_g32856 [Phytophthora fragariae]|nr:hypothetical protein PF006_g32755 [Phytophthora fragariae]KAE9157373.1 hypothetical protein PF005_g32856 [Phytophthora fragariae]KAE9159499.1 hypothetical protein PF002_g32846 [Phytophthora fragariae]KAE9260718.1 hypothetical protein PF001_g32639 [Phytophthora fragariae]